jgi:hypothetical protein
MKTRGRQVCVSAPDGEPEIDGVTFQHLPLQNRLATLQAPTVIGSGSRIYVAKTGLLERSMSAPGQKRTSRHIRSTSDLPPKADIPCYGAGCVRRLFISVSLRPDKGVGLV